METVEAPISLDISQRQQLVYASLMRFGSETISLRNRCLDHVVMNGLLGSSAQSALKIGELQEKVHFGTHAPILRPEILRESLLRLEKEGKISWVLIKKKKAYYLTQSGSEFMNTAIVSAETLYKPVVTRLVKYTDHLISAEVSTKICTDFICEAFAKCGLGIAKDLEGQTDFPHSGDLSAAFDAAVDGLEIPLEARQTLEARCLSLFKSRDLADRRLIFYLTQGYYFAQLLGFDHKGFDPIAEQAFVGAVFYLDTNVLLAGLLPGNGAPAFAEIVALAKRIGITLRVTRASLNEARRVAADRLTELKRMQDSVPAELAEKSLDDFVTHFYEQRKLKSDLSPEEYLSGFERISEIVQSWGIEIDEAVEDEMLKGRDYPELGNRIQQLAAKFRKGRMKSDAVLRHDLAHYARIEDERTTNRKTWFLTRDRSLISSAEVLCKDGSSPFCFGLIGFLQSISPYIVSDIEGNSLSILFSELLKEQVITTDKLFDSRELVLLAEMHSDVLSTPVENLLPAIDFVKFSVLKGKAYRPEDMPLVSLELRKFLASSKEEQKRVLEAQNARLESDARAEREAATQDRKARLDAERALLQSQTELTDQASRLRSAESDKTDLQEKLVASQNLTRFLLGCTGIIAGVMIWAARSAVTGAIESRYGNHPSAGVLLQTLGVFVFCFPALKALRNSYWRPEIRMGLGTIILFVAIWVTKMISASVAADVASYLAIAAAGAGVFVFPKWKPESST